MRYANIFLKMDLLLMFFAHDYFHIFTLIIWRITNNNINFYPRPYSLFMSSAKLAFSSPAVVSNMPYNIFLLGYDIGDYANDG